MAKYDPQIKFMHRCLAIRQTVPTRDIKQGTAQNCKECRLSHQDLLFSYHPVNCTTDTAPEFIPTG